MPPKIGHLLRRCAACNEKLGYEPIVVVDDYVSSFNGVLNVF
jgi:hypothetical protein